MPQQLHGTGPASSTPDESSNRDGDGSAATTPPAGPGPGSGEAACLSRPEGRLLGLTPLPSLSSFSRGQYGNLQPRPRIRRRDAKPSAQQQKSATKSSLVQYPAQPSPSHRLGSIAHHSDGRTVKHSTPANASESSFGQFTHRMSDLCLRGGGNAPVFDLEVDVACDSQENTGNNAMQMPPQGVSISTHQLQSPSSCDFASHNDKPLPSSRHLKRMQNSGTALAAATSRFPASWPLPPSQQDPHMLGGPPKPVESVAQRPPITTSSMTVTSASTAGALSSPSTSLAVTSAGFQPHHYAPSIAQSHYLPADMPHQESVSAKRAKRDNPPACLPLSPETLALPHHAPIHSDVPSSGYDMKSWLESSSTVEAPPSLAAGTVDSNNMPSVFITAMAQARASRRTGSSTHLQRSSPLKQAYTPQQPVPSCLDERGPVDLANGSNLPVADLEVDMIGNEVASYDSTDDIMPDTPAAIEASQHGLLPSGPSTDGALGSILAAYLEMKRNRPDAEADGRDVPLSQRIHMAHMQVDREAMFQQAGFVDDEAPAGGESPAKDCMEVDLNEPTSPYGGQSVVDGSYSYGECGLSLRPDSEQDGGVRRYTGLPRHRLSSEVAMRCTNLVYSKPRMRRRRLATDSKTATPAGSVSSTSAKDGSVGDGTEAESTQSNGKERQHSTRDRRSKLGRRREIARQPSRNLLVQAQGQTHVDAWHEADAQVRAGNALLPGAKADCQPPCPPTEQLPLPPTTEAAHQTDAPLPHTMP